VQRLRKDSGLEITDRIALAIAGPEAIVAAAQRHEAFIGGETLALTVTIDGGVDEAAYPHVQEVDIDGTAARIGLKRAEA